MYVVQAAERCTFKWLKMEGAEAREKVSAFLVEDSSGVTTEKKRLLPPIAKWHRWMPIAESVA